MSIELLWAATAQPTRGGSLNGLYAAFKLPWNPSLQKSIPGNMYISIRVCSHVNTSHGVT